MASPLAPSKTRLRAHISRERPRNEFQDLLEDLLNSCEKKALQISNLEAENSWLRAQLEVAEVILDNRISGSSTGNREEVAGRSILLPWDSRDQYIPGTDRNQASHEDYDSLMRKHEELRLEFDHCKAYYAQREIKYQKAKNAVKKWHTYINRIPGSRETEQPVSTNDSSTSRPPEGTSNRQSPQLAPNLSNAGMNVVPRERAAPDPMTELLSATRASITCVPSSPPRESEPHTDTSELMHAERHVASTQTTEDDTNQDVVRTEHIKKESFSDDEPIVVNARSLKRKRSPPTLPWQSRRWIKEEPSDNSTNLEVNSQDYSSPQKLLEPSARTDTLESDDLNVPLDSPYEPNDFENLPPDTDEEHTPRPRLEICLPSMNVRQVTTPSIPTDKPPREVHKSKSTSKKVDDPQALRKPRLARPGSTPLQQLSPNVRTGSRKSSRSGSSKPKSSNYSTNRNVAMLAEDGESADDRHFEAKQQKTSVTGQILESLLQPSLSNSVRLSTTSASNLSPAAAKRQCLAQGTSEPHSTDAQPATAPPHAHHRPSTLHESPSPIDPDSEPLRLRPLSSLSLDDFRVNPKYLDAEFAFADTLRGREQHRGVAACTDAECCGGAFVKAAELLGDGGAAALSGQTDAQALEAYLGGDWADVLRGYGGAAERGAVLTRAHAHALAQAHGRHRPAFARRTSPPGFWRTDMPTTQETDEDRMRADALVRRKVEERWREALREGGRWVFRDE